VPLRRFPLRREACSDKTPEILQNAIIQFEASHFHHTKAFPAKADRAGRAHPTRSSRIHQPSCCMRRATLPAHPDAAVDYWLMHLLQMDMQVGKTVFQR